jgi:6-phosphogluconate dehydrogenase
MSTPTKYDFGMIGLGVMGRSLLLNMGDHGVKGAGFDKDASKGQSLEQESTNGNLKGFSDIKEFVASLNTPRAIMMLVPAGKIVDDVIEELLPLINEGDLIIDGGNTYYTDTNRRFDYLNSKGIHFFGMGVSGGE